MFLLQRCLRPLALRDVARHRDNHPSFGGALGMALISIHASLPLLRWRSISTDFRGGNAGDDTAS